MRSPNRLATIGIVVFLCAGGIAIWIWLNKLPSDQSSLIRPKATTKQVTESHKILSRANNSAPLPRLGSRGNVDQNTADEADEYPSALSVTLSSCLDDGPLDVGSRVRALQGLRGGNFSEADRSAASRFLSGKTVADRMGKGSTQWLSDELLTALRLQETPWPGMAKALSEIAFQPETDPVVRDYIMQHLGLYWETAGPQPAIDAALWRAVATSDETTPGTALIALSRGYARDQQPKSLAKVRQQALALAVDPNSTLAVRVTALSIAGEGGGKEVKELAANLVRNDATPVILKKVALRVVNP